MFFGSSLYTLFATKIQFYTGYSMELWTNAFTISSLIQITIKLIFSLFLIKLNINLQFLLLIMLIPLYLKFNTFYVIRTKLATFVLFYVPERSFTQIDEIEDENGNTTGVFSGFNNAWYNLTILHIIHFLIGFRLFILSEPILAFFLKVLVINYFFTNNYLFFAYFISFIFIFSPFIFLLSDETFVNWRLSLQGILSYNEEESFIVNTKNIKIMTYWSLRSVIIWDLHNSFENIITDNKIYYYDEFLEKFDLNVPMVTKIKNENLIHIFITISSLNYYFFIDANYEKMTILSFFKSIINNNESKYVIATYDDKWFIPKSNFEKNIYKNIPNHKCLLGFKKEEYGTFLEITTFTSFKEKNNNIKFPFTFPLTNPSIVVPLGIQGGTTKKLLLKDTTESQIFLNQLFQSGYVFNKTNFHNLSLSQIINLDLQLKNNNYYFYDETLQHFTFNEINYFNFLLKANLSFPLEIQLALWAPSQKHMFSIDYSLELLKRSNKLLKNNIHDLRVEKLLNLQKPLLNKPNTYISPYFNERKLSFDDSLLVNASNNIMRHDNNNLISVNTISYLTDGDKTDSLD